MTKQELVKKCADLYEVNPEDITKLRSNRDTNNAKTLAQYCLYLSGKTGVKISEFFGCSPSAVCYNLRRIHKYPNMIAQARQIMEGVTHVG
jgi:hypothetical protein